MPEKSLPLRHVRALLATAILQLEVVGALIPSHAIGKRADIATFEERRVLRALDESYKYMGSEFLGSNRQHWLTSEGKEYVADLVRQHGYESPQALLDSGKFDSGSVASGLAG